MLKAYLDRARRKEAGGIMSVAAAVFDPATYDFFLHEWQPILSAWNADAFHATDFYPGAGQFRRKRRDGNIDPALVEQYQRHSREIPAIIGRWVEKLFVLSFFEGEYQSIAPEPWRERFGGVHRVGAQLMLGGIGFWANKTNYQGEIEYFYETGDDEEAAMHDALCKLYRQPDQRAHTRMASTPIGVDKGKARGLEVADFIGWHWNKWWVDSAISESPRPMRKDIKSLMDALKIKQEKIDVALVTGHALEDFLVSHGCTIKTPARSTGASVSPVASSTFWAEIARAANLR